MGRRGISVCPRLPDGQEQAGMIRLSNEVNGKEFH